MKNLPYRVNVIGYSGRGSEVDIEIKRRDLMGKFAIDKANTKFRVEFYKNETALDLSAKSAESSTNLKGTEKFAGMIIVDFE